MALLKDFFIKEGNFLFRWRSYIPLLFILIIFISLQNFYYPKNKHNYDVLWEFVCLGISLFGLSIRIVTVGFTPEGTSGRNTEKQIAEQLNTTGLYSIVRNPLYLGNFFMWVGPALFPRNIFVSILIFIIFFLYYERIIYVEEEFLLKKFGNDYKKWAEKTPLFIPNFKLWKKPEQKFSYKKVIKKEYNGFFALICVFTLLEIIGDYFVQKYLEFDKIWLILFVISFIIFISIKILKKFTKFLN
ncbi:MAG TPA: isoprenylcysteine carboxylmethyltransferase family protein [bacterium]|nr:isoprenylcysteine carboxylmethyltransferase family protein [bacterium]HOL47273.1 isoprenylcysteine carboxylmethyltransferase family protein [bacterium]HPQ19638.1 isoprenylcysteine carboxylmethyltransferase family protein [bacterium]